MRFAFGRSIVLHKRTKTGYNADGNVVYDDVPTPVDGVPIWPYAGTELVQGQDTAFIGLAAILPIEVDPTHIDYVEIPDEPGQGNYEIDGEPGPYSSPLTGTTPGYQVHLTRIEG